MCCGLVLLGVVWCVFGCLVCGCLCVFFFSYAKEMLFVDVARILLMPVDVLWVSVAGCCVVCVWLSCV